MHCGAIALTAAVLTMAAVGCEREARRLSPESEAARASEWTRLTKFQAGVGHEVPAVPSASRPADERRPMEVNAYDLSEGKRLYTSYNCVGCHAHGGGDMGPPLKDDKWIYGSEPEQIFATIVEGRPNGMPAWGGRINDKQLWQIVAYVRSLGGLASKTAAPGRDDDLNVVTPEQSSESKKPKDSSLPKSGEMPK